uniref:Retrotransposon protein putative n=1 Tax=Albugo laibachii Nc14 TaxID=890382 RepID=F0X0M9_9STRA|nr:retrotransposon protein putative [Albugo laibachii Nc14]|eukprot:CCA27322.1 retrotransposon protein putative [Albugo laibachii Nc14]
MGVKLSMTTAHKAQADGQTERQNLVLEDALRCLVSHNREIWAKLLGILDYAHATSVNASHKLTPFETDTGRKVSNLISHEYRDFDGLDRQSISKFTSKFAKDRKDLVRKARENLEQAQERKKYYDSKRTSLTFNFGDLVLLYTKNLPRKTVNAHMELKKAKLAAKNVGPVDINKMINPNVANLKLL